MPFLTIDKLEKTYPDGTRAVRGVSLEVERGELIVLLGPSGCGKTTTLRMTAGLEIATGGRILLDGADVTTLRPSQRDVGFVFQFYALYPHLRVKDNIAFPLVSTGVDGRETDRRVRDVASRLGITELLTRYPRQLSGGDQQRVSLARAMVREPRLWLMDEPLGALDAEERTGLRDFIRQRQLEQKVTTLYVTHDQQEAMSIADRIVVMEGGLIRQVGRPIDVYDQPADTFVAAFVGSPGMNFLEGAIEQSSFVTTAGERIELRQPYPPGPATLGVRPEWLLPDPAGALEGVVRVVESMGSHRLVYVEGKSGRMCVRVESLSASVGDSIRLSMTASRVCVFAASGARLHSGTGVPPVKTFPITAGTAVPP